MKCQILFSGKNKKNIINLSSAENAQRVVKVNDQTNQLFQGLARGHNKYFMGNQYALKVSNSDMVIFSSLPIIFQEKNLVTPYLPKFECPTC